MVNSTSGNQNRVTEPGGGAIRPNVRPWVDWFDGVIVGFQLLTYLVLALTPLAPNKYGDGDFHREAKTIASVLHGAQPWSDIVFDRALGPTLFYAAPYSLLPAGSSDESYWLAGFIWTVLLMSASLLLVRRTAENFGGMGAGRLAALLTVASPFQVYYSYGILAESPAYLSVVLMMFGWSKMVVADARRFQIIGGSIAAYSGLFLFLFCRPNAFILWPIALLFSLIGFLYRRGRTGFFKLNLAGLACVAILLALGGWIGKKTKSEEAMLKQGGYFVYVAFHGRFQFRDEPWNWKFWVPSSRKGTPDFENWMAEFEKLRQKSLTTGVKISDLQAKWILDDLKENPILAVRQFLIKALNIHIPLVNSMSPHNFKFGPLSGMSGYVVFHLAVNLVSFAALAGFLGFLWFRRKGLVDYWPFWGPWLALVLFHSAIYAEPRYLFPGRPGMVVLAAIFIMAWTRRGGAHSHIQR